MITKTDKPPDPQDIICTCLIYAAIMVTIWAFGATLCAIQLYQEVSDCRLKAASRGVAEWREIHDPNSGAESIQFVWKPVEESR